MILSRGRCAYKKLSIGGTLLNTSDNEDIGAKEIHQLHISFGWDGIGYHK